MLAGRVARRWRESAARGRCCGAAGEPIAFEKCRSSEAARTKMGGQALLNRRLLFALTGAAALALAAGAPGARRRRRRSRSASCRASIDPFYQVMQIGVEKAAAELGIEVVTQIPPTWGVEAQTPILDALVARGDLDYIITAPVEKDQMVGAAAGGASMPASRSSPSTPSSATATMWAARSPSRSATSAPTTSRAGASRRAASPRRSAARAPSTSTPPTRTSARSRAASRASPR